MKKSSGRGLHKGKQVRFHWQFRAAEVRAVALTFRVFRVFRGYLAVAVALPFP
jgi:hypothetical protein